MFNTSKIIRKLMIDRDISVTPLSRKIGITQQNLSRKLNNVNESYTLEYLQNVVKGMNCYIQVNIVDSDTHKVLYTMEELDSDSE